MVNAYTGFLKKLLKNEQCISRIYMKKETIVDGNTFIPSHQHTEMAFSKPLILRIFAACKFLKI